MENNIIKCKEFIEDISNVSNVASFVLNKLKKKNIKYVFLNGEIGSGKTTFVKAFATLLNEQKTVISPTFNKMFVYDKFVHIDAYNMSDADFEGLLDYFDDKFVLIEWPSNLSCLNFEREVKINIKWINEDNRNYLICWKE